MKKVLLLDDSIDTRVTVTLKDLPTHASVVTEKQLGNPDPYQSTTELLDQLKAYQGDEFDLVILGNNQGIGLREGQALCDALRSKTIVVSHGLISPDLAGEYRAMGFARCMTRMVLANRLRAELGL